jgi:hypothetical protein
MPKIKFVDLNKALVESVRAVGIESVHGDYFLEAYKTPQPVFMTASNPLFTFGGGLDYHFTQHFPKLCEYKRIKSIAKGENERISNVCFAITVNDECLATKETIFSAIKFAMENTKQGETLILSGVGTGIGRLSNEDFVEVLSKII